MITDRFLSNTNNMRKGLCKKRLFVCFVIICFFFLYANRQFHELIVKKERSMSRFKHVNIEPQSELRGTSYYNSDFQDHVLAIAPLIRPKLKQCIPRKNIAFLKTHRTGSSTVTNILNRFGEARNLTFVLPRKGKYRLGWPYRFTLSSFASPLRNRTPNILCNHARYNRAVLDLVMPKDTVHVTILRDPADQFPSAFYQFQLDKILGIQSSDALEEFLSHPWIYLEKKLREQNQLTAMEFHRLQLSRNGMLFDLGMSPESYDKIKLIDSYIKRLEKDLDLVMLTEYFVESLVLLRHLMCWDLDDVVYFALNARPTHRKTLESSTQRIRDWNGGDYSLYRHFNRTFWKKVEQYGRGFRKDVQFLQSKINYWRKTCTNFAKRKLVPSHSWQEITRRVRGVEGTREDRKWMCIRMLANETSYVDYLKKKQGV